MLCSLFSCSTSLQCSSNLKITVTGQHHYYLIDGTSLCVEAVNPYSMIVFDTLGSAVVTPEIVKQGGELYSFEQQSMKNNNFTGIWFGEKLGKVLIETKTAVTVKFTVVVFPKECTVRYVSNTRKSSFSLTPRKTNAIQSLCYFNGAYGDYNYDFVYDLKENDYFRLIRNDNFLRQYTGNNYFSGLSKSDDPVVVLASTTNTAFNSTLTMTSSCDDIIPDTNLTKKLDSNEPLMLYGEFLNDFPVVIEDNPVSDIITICLIVIFLVCIVCCIIYRIYRWRKNIKEQELYDLMKASEPKKKYKKIIRNKKHNKDVLKELNAFQDNIEDEAK